MGITIRSTKIKHINIAITFLLVSIYNGYIHAQIKIANSETFHMYSKKYIYYCSSMYLNKGKPSHLHTFSFILVPEEL